MHHWQYMRVRLTAELEDVGSATWKANLDVEKLHIILLHSACFLAILRISTFASEFWPSFVVMLMPFDKTVNYGRKWDKCCMHQC